jgi:hypothetical protein
LIAIHRILTAMLLNSFRLLASLNQSQYPAAPTVRARSVICDLKLGRMS